jgi:CRP-like cAMP-binding protein
MEVPIHDGLRMQETSNPGGSDAAALLTFIKGAGKPTTAKAGKVLFREEETCQGIFFVESGELELTISSGNKKMTLGVALLGQLLGLAPAIREAQYPFTATAISDCQALFVPAEEVRSYLRQNPETCLHTVQILGSEVLDLSANMIRPLRLQPRYPKI